MKSNTKRRVFGILFFLFGVFYIVAFALYVLKNDWIGTIYCAIVGAVTFSISFLVASGNYRWKK